MTDLFDFPKIRTRTETEIDIFVDHSEWRETSGWIRTAVDCFRETRDFVWTDETIAINTAIRLYEQWFRDTFNHGTLDFYSGWRWDDHNCKDVGVWLCFEFDTPKAAALFKLAHGGA